MDFLWRVFARKVIRSGVQALVAAIAAMNLQKFGLDLQIDPVVATAAAYAGLEALRDFLKHKLDLEWIP